ncbi:hypothetical protein HKX42_08705 [Salinisphaera sp. USBA-960]|nr:hypothetical protein [Salifodinibacter halophilus]NNC26953.1 hypothetical protein [Salifodinibacter halophilus]
MNLRAKAVGALAVNMLFWMLMLLATAAVLALIGALYLALAPLIGQPGAIAIAGATLLLMVAVVGGLVYRAVRPRINSAAPSADGSDARSDEDRDRSALGDMAVDWTRDHTGGVMVAALAAGVVVAASPGLRGALFRAVEPSLREQAARTIDRFADRS